MDHRSYPPTHLLPVPPFCLNVTDWLDRPELGYDELWVLYKFAGVD